MQDAQPRIARSARVITKAAAIAGLAAALAAPAAAQQGRPATTEGVTFTLDLAPTYAFASDFDTAGGDWAVTRLPVSISASTNVSDNLNITFAASYETSLYDFDSATFIGGTTDPFDEVHSLSFSLMGRYQFEGNWGAIAGGFVSFDWEQGADMGDGFTGGGFGAVTWAQSRDFVIGAGLGVSSQIEDDADFFPYIYLRWQIDEQWLLETQRMGLRLTYEHSDSLDFYAFGGYDSREFRLDDNAPHALADGIVQDSSVVLGLGLGWEPKDAQGLRIEGNIGARVWQEFETFNANGTKIADMESDVTPTIGLTVSYDF